MWQVAFPPGDTDCQATELLLHQLDSTQPLHTVRVVGGLEEGGRGACLSPASHLALKGITAMPEAAVTVHLTRVDAQPGVVLLLWFSSTPQLSTH